MFHGAATPSDLTSDNRSGAMAERMASNRAHPGSAADIMKVAMLGSIGELTLPALPDASPGA